MKREFLSKTGIMEDLQLLIDQLKQITDHTKPSDNEGTIMVKNSGGRTLYYLNDGKGNLEYLNSSKADRIPKLAQARFNAEIVKVAELEIKQLTRGLEALKGNPKKLTDIDDVYDHLPDGLKPFITPHPLSSEEYARQWQESNAVVKRKNIHKQDDYHKFKTIRGDYVGSKSEVMIADRLLANGIPYHYEVAFIPEAEMDRSRPVYGEYGDIVGFEAMGFDPFERDTLHPDFYVLNKRTGKAYFWEHLGKLHDPTYCHTNLNRLIRMLDAGYTIGEDILITHENANAPLRTESIDEIIEKYLK